jgi:hypothetical protein
MARSKYGVAKKEDRTRYGVTYDSKLEMQYRVHLEQLERATNLKDRVVEIQEQVPYVFYIELKKIFTYKLDFLVTYGDGRKEYVDVKGVKTAIYRIKKKCIEAFYDIEIKEVFASKF